MTHLELERQESNAFYSLEHTPTWVVGLVCVVFIAVSLLMQRGLQKLGNWLVKKHQKPMNEALAKVKEELMLLGFISLLLTAAQNPISRLCMPDYWADHMLPCHFDESTAELLNETSGSRTPPAYTTVSSDSIGSMPNPHHIRALLVDHDTFPNSSPNMRMPAREGLPSDVDEYVTKRDVHRRTLSEMATHHYCSPGHVPVLSTESLHQLHIFIFVMAVIHVFYSCFTMLLGFTQLRSWKKWEEETQVDNYNYTAEIKKSFNESTFMMALGRQNSFVASRTSAAWSTTFTGIWINSFFRQFGRPVTKADYLSLRLGFIKNHNAPMRLNFHKYMMGSLEDDLKTVIGISGYLWVFVIFFMILNVHGWYTYFWMSFIPVLINIVIGTKLQDIITQLSMETAHSHGICVAPVKPRDELFWFNKPHLLLYLIHFVLFQNAFELAFCIWLMTTFGFNSCFFNQHGFIITRVIVGVLAQVLCSHSTLPLYALVSQMGSHYKKAIFDLPVSNAIQGWRSKAEETRKKLSQELNSSGHRKGFEYLHANLHHVSSDGSSHHSSNSGHAADPDYEDDQSSHHSFIRGHKFHLHPDSPKISRTPRTPKTPKSKSSRQTPLPVASATTAGAESESETAAVEQPGGEESEVRGEIFEPEVTLVVSPWPGPYVARTLSFKLPREESIVERDGPVTAPCPVNIVDRITLLPSRKLKLMMIDDSFRPPVLQLPFSSCSLPPTPKPLAASARNSHSLPSTPMARPVAPPAGSDTSASSLPTLSMTSTDERLLHVQITSPPSTNDHDEIENDPAATTAEVGKGREQEVV